MHEAALGANNEGPTDRPEPLHLRPELPTLESMREHCTPKQQPLVLLACASRPHCPPALQLMPDSSSRDALLYLCSQRSTGRSKLCFFWPVAASRALDNPSKGAITNPVMVIEQAALLITAHLAVPASQPCQAPCPLPNPGRSCKVLCRRSAVRICILAPSQPTWLSLPASASSPPALQAPQVTLRVCLPMMGTLRR